MSMKSQLRRKIDPDLKAKAEQTVARRVPEFIRKMAAHAAMKIRKQYGIDPSAWRLPKDANL